jgi:hypothetical protein
VHKLKAWEAYRENRLSLPPGYSLEFGADVLVLRRDVGSLVAMFSARGAVPCEVSRIAWADHRDRSREPA